MNAALFMLTSAWMAGADPVPGPGPGAPPPPPIVAAGPSCQGGCGTACDTGCGKPSLFSRFKGRHSKGDCCEAAPPCAPPAPVCKPAPVCCAPAPIVHCKPAPVCAPAPVCKPAPVCAPAAPCGGCGTACDDGCGKPGLFSRLKGRFGRKHGGCGDVCADACAPGVAPIAPGGKPEVIPPPKKEMPKGGGGVTGITIEPIVTPVVAPRPPIEPVLPANPF